MRLRNTKANENENENEKSCFMTFDFHHVVCCLHGVIRIIVTANLVNLSKLCSLLISYTGGLRLIDRHDKVILTSPHFAHIFATLIPAPLRSSNCALS